MWADIRCIRHGLRVRDSMRRFLGSWHYNELLSLLCCTGPCTKLSWIEAVVTSGDRPELYGGLGRVRYLKDKSIVPYLLAAVSFVHTFWRLGKWAIDGDNRGIALYKTMSLR